MSKRAFWFHYNKPASRSAKRNKATIHYKGECLIVDNVVCNVPIAGRDRKTQPMWVLAGKAKDITIKDGVAIIT